MGRSEKLLEIYNEKVNSLSESDIKELLNCNNNLWRYELINRVLIMEQTKKDVIDCRSEEEWRILGRRVIDKSNSIDVVGEKIGTKYVDCETGEEVKYGELSPSEMEMAISSGIVKQVSEKIGFSVTSVYDVSDTECIIGQSRVYQEYKPLKYSEIKNAMWNVYGVYITGKKGKKKDEYIIDTSSPERAIESILEKIISMSGEIYCKTSLKFAIKSTLGLKAKDIDSTIEVEEISKIYSIVSAIFSGSGRKEMSTEDSKEYMNRIFRYKKVMNALDSSNVRRCINQNLT